MWGKKQNGIEETCIPCSGFVAGVLENWEDKEKSFLVSDKWGLDMSFD